MDSANAGIEEFGTAVGPAALSGGSKDQSDTFEISSESSLLMPTEGDLCGFLEGVELRGVEDDRQRCDRLFCATAKKKVEIPIRQVFK